MDEAGYPVRLNLSAVLFQRKNSVFLSQQISISIRISQILVSFVSAFNEIN
jgi:hypothetical protein